MPKTTVQLTKPGEGIYKLLGPQSILDQTLTIRPRPVRGTNTRLPNGLTMPARRYLWYYMGHSPTGELVATFHPGEGIVVTGQTEPWRVMRHHGIRTLLMPTPLGGTPLASLFHASAGLFATTCRVTMGESRIGGWELIGRGWRGGVLRHASSYSTSLTLTGEGDPPNLYIMEPSSREGTPLPVALLVAYVLIEQEIREGAWVKRPTAPDAETVTN